MSRKKNYPVRKISPDPKFWDVKVSRFINYLIRRGKKSLAENIFYTAIEVIEEKMKTDKGLDVFRKAITNVSPMMEVKSKRIGGATYQVPIEVAPKRKFALATRWMISFARKRSESTMAEKLAGEFMDASKKEGASIRKREETHRMAEANKAFAHFR